MAQTLDGLTLPNYASFEELIEPNAAKNYSLDGTMYVDYNGSVRRGWKITYGVLTAAEYTALRAKFDKQFSSSTFLTFVDTDLSINLSVFLNMPDERRVVWNKTVVMDLQILLEPQSADVI